MRDELVAHLIAKQDSLGLTSREMARRLGLTEGYWCHIRKGRRQLRRDALQRAIKLFPELAGLFLADALRDEKVPA